MSKKIHKTKGSRIKLTPPQRSSMKSDITTEPLSSDSESPKEPSDTASPVNPSSKEPQTDSPPSEQQGEGGVPPDSEVSPKSAPQPHPESKKSSFLKALHKKKPVKNPLEEELRALQRSYLYLKADFENYKKQMLKERSELLRYGGEEFIRALITNVLDDFDRAYGDLRNTQSLEDFKSGIDLIYKNLQKTLNRFHVEAQDPQGQPFDPNCHEALSRQPTDKMPKDHVLITFKKAYTLYEKLIRPAQVIVAAPVGDSSDEGSSKGQ